MNRTETTRENIAEIIKQSSRTSRQAYLPVEAIIETENNQASAEVFRGSADRQRGYPGATSCRILSNLKCGVVYSQNTSTNEQDLKTERFLKRIDSKEQSKLSLQAPRQVGAPRPKDNNSESINGGLPTTDGKEETYT